MTYARNGLNLSIALVLLHPAAMSVADAAGKGPGMTVSPLLAPGEKVYPAYPVLFRVSLSAELVRVDGDVIGDRFAFSLNGKRLDPVGFGRPVHIGPWKEASSVPQAEAWLVWLQHHGPRSAALFLEPGQYVLSIKHISSGVTAVCTVRVESTPPAEAEALRDYSALFAGSSGYQLSPRNLFRDVCDELPDDLSRAVRSLSASHGGSRYAYLAEMPLLYQDVQEAMKAWREKKDMPEQERLDEAQVLLNRCRRVYKKCDCVQYRSYALDQVGYIHKALGRRSVALATWDKQEREFPTSAEVIAAKSGRERREELIAEIKAAVDSVDESLIFGPLPGCTLPPEPESGTRTESAAGENRVSSSAFAWMTAIVGILVAALAAILLYRRSRPSGDGAPPRTPST